MNHLNFLKNIKKTDLEGIFWVTCSCFCISLMIAIVKATSAHIHVTQILMMRCFFSFLLFAPLIIKTNGTIFKTKKLGLHFVRSISGFISMLSWFYVATEIPLPEAVSITFIVPILTTAAAVVILKEKVGYRLWVSLILGFIGVLIIVRPGFETINFAHFICLISTISWAVSNILTKQLSETDSPKTVALYVAIIIFIFSIPAAAPYLKAMTLMELFWFFLLGVSANLAHISLSIAYGKTDLSILQPFDFTRLIFVSLIAYFAFGQLVDIYMITGSLIIVFSSFYLSLNKKSEQKLPIIKGEIKEINRDVIS